MKKALTKRSQKSGLPPGTYVYVGEKRVEQVRIIETVYSASSYSRKELTSVQETTTRPPEGGVLWLHVEGLHEVHLLEQIEKKWHIHPLAIEDILNTQQKPKLEIFDDYAFLVFKAVHFSRHHSPHLRFDHAAIILGHGYVLSFVESPLPLLDTIWKRLEADALTRLRRLGADYLAYSIVDLVVDEWFGVLEFFGESIEQIEDTVVQDPRREVLRKIHAAKRELIRFRRQVWPLREMLASLTRPEFHLVRRETIPYLRDLYDHVVQVLKTIESQRDLLAGILDVYLSSLSNRMDEIMKLLTVIGTIFIPLTLITGIYGMNFKWMPELNWRWGYPAVWAVMITIALLMVRMFKKKGWI